VCTNPGADRRFSIRDELIGPGSVWNLIGAAGGIDLDNETQVNQEVGEPIRSWVDHHHDIIDANVAMKNTG
jgi:hypothetical protein